MVTSAINLYLRFRVRQIMDKRVQTTITNNGNISHISRKSKTNFDKMFSEIILAQNMHQPMTVFGWLTMQEVVDLRDNNLTRKTIMVDILPDKKTKGPILKDNLGKYRQHRL